MQATAAVSRPAVAMQSVQRIPAPFKAAVSARAVLRPCRRAAVTPSAVAAPEAPASQAGPTAGVASTYAVVEIGGHQLVVEEGRWYTVNRLEAAPGSKIQLGRVLALKHDGKFTVGKPYLEGPVVQAEVLEELKGPKVIVYKMKSKKHYRRTNGHRQPLSKILITKIAA